ncbi:MAG TPA: N-6 DNA methylase [Pirellulales bacterium]
MLDAIAGAIRDRGACESVLEAIAASEGDRPASADLVALAREELEGSIAEAERAEPDALAGAALGEAYQRLLGLRPTRDALGKLVLSRHSRRRKAHGSFYTPAPLVERLLDVSLDPVLDETLAGSSPRSQARAILSLRILDPACGDGRLLRAAASRLAMRLATVRSKSDLPSVAAIRAARAEIASRCLVGIDRDPAAVLLARYGLHCDGATAPAARIHHADAFAVAFAKLDAQASNRGGFDLVLGNPPFANAIEGDLPASIVARARANGSQLGGTADLASYFLELGLQLARPGGRVAMIQPRPTFTSPATEAFRDRLPAGSRPNALYAPEHSTLFRGALVFTGVVVLGPAATCLVSRDADPARVVWRETVVDGARWWDALQLDDPPSLVDSASLADSSSDGPESRNNIAIGERPAVVLLGEVCEAAASLTTEHAYALRSAVVDEPRGNRLKLVTTGLIDPGVCFWGVRVCRYLKSDYRCPRIDEARLASGSLARRAIAARRPKVLVAGLSKRVEAFCDAAGECLGGVSTFTIYHPADDVPFLQRIAAYLASPDVDLLFRRTLSAGAVGGGDLVMTKRFLKALPIPTRLLELSE